MADTKQKIGWIGMGRMGFSMAERLLKAGHDVSIWNRTKSKAEPLTKSGGKDRARLTAARMIPKSGYRFSENIMLQR